MEETRTVKIDKETGRMIMEDLVFTKRLGNGNYCPLTLADLPNDLQQTDRIHINYDDGYYSENDSWDPYTEVCVYRRRLETDEERATRLADADRWKNEEKNRRYKIYLQLKNEFEKDDEQTPSDQNQVR